MASTSAVLPHVKAQMYCSVCTAACEGTDLLLHVKVQMYSHM